MLRKLDDFLFITLNMGILVFWVYCAMQVPESSASLLIFFIAFAVALYVIFDIIWRINNIFVERDIKRYICSGFDSKIINRYR